MQLMHNLQIQVGELHRLKIGGGGTPFPRVLLCFDHWLSLLVGSWYDWRISGIADCQWIIIQKRHVPAPSSTLFTSACVQMYMWVAQPDAVYTLKPEVQFAN